MMKNDSLEALLQWYQAQCDGTWEHQYGITIDTLDNPGWSLRIDVTETALEGVPFTAVEHQLENVQSWWRCWRDGDIFHAACGARNLQATIDIFNQWATNNQSQPDRG
jgi:hypothetical protein